MQRDSRILLLAFQNLRRRAIETVRRRNMEWKLAHKVARRIIRFAVFIWSKRHFRLKSYRRISFKISTVHETGIYTRTLNSWFLLMLNLRKVHSIVLACRRAGRTVLLNKFFSAWMSRKTNTSRLVRKISMVITSGCRALLIKYICRFHEYANLAIKEKRIQDRLDARSRRKRLVHTFQIFSQHSKIRTNYVICIHQQLKNKLTLLSLLFQWQFCASRSLAALEMNARKYCFHPFSFIRGAGQNHNYSRTQSFEAWARTTHKRRKLSAADKCQINKHRRRILIRSVKVWQSVWLFSSGFRGAESTFDTRRHFRLRNQTIIKWRKWVSKASSIRTFISQTKAMISHRISCRAWITWILKTSASAEIFHHSDVLYSQRQQAAVFRIWISWMMLTNLAMEAREQLKALNKKQMIVPKKIKIASTSVVENYLQPTSVIAHPGSALVPIIAHSRLAQADDVSMAQRCKRLGTFSQRQSRRLLTIAVVEWHNIASVRPSRPPLPRSSSSSFIVSC